MGLKSKRKITLVIVTMLMFYCFLFGLAAKFSITSASQGEYLSFILCLCLCYLSFESIKMYIRNSATIYIDTDKIAFSKREIYFWKDIDSITLETKKIFPSMKFLGKFEWHPIFPPFSFGRNATGQEAIMLCFKKTKAKYIFYDAYANVDEIKEFIKQVTSSR